MKKDKTDLYSAINKLTDNWHALELDTHHITILQFCFRQMNRYQGNTSKWSILDHHTQPEFSMGYADVPMKRQTAADKIEELIEIELLVRIKTGGKGNNSLYKFGRTMLELLFSEQTQFLMYLKGYIKNSESANLNVPQKVH